MISVEHIIPSVLMRRAVRTRANRVALNITVPSLFRGIFMDTRRWNKKQKKSIQVRVYTYLEYLIMFECVYSGYKKSTRPNKTTGFSGINISPWVNYIRSFMWAVNKIKNLIYCKIITFWGFIIYDQTFTHMYKQ